MPSKTERVLIAAAVIAAGSVSSSVGAMPEIDLDELDLRLLADLKQQVADGLTTQEEADDLALRIAGKPKGERPCG